jgi:restriction endonuclease
MTNKGGGPPQSQDWRIYERFVAALEAKCATDTLTVIPNAKLIGSISGIERQVDVLIDARIQEEVGRRVIVDAKRRRRKIDVKDVEEFEGMLRDCRAQRGVIVCSSGYTAAALRRAQEAITIRLLPLEELDSVDLMAWEPCRGVCSGRRSRRKNSGWVLFDQPFGLGIGDSAMSVVVIGKCDECCNFHVWCWTCGSKFALLDEGEHHCGCDWFWLTAVEDEGIDDRGNALEAVLLLLIVPRAGRIFVADRRPLR